MTTCDLCRRDAVTFVRYNGTHLCADHFLTYVDRRVKREVRKQIDVHKGDRIAVAVSGGKDSMVALKMLSSVFNERNGVEVHAITIDEGIEGYRPPSVDIVRRFCESEGVQFHLRSFSELGVTMDEVAPVSGDSSPCTYCGVFRRMLMNDEARRIGAKYLATGHNLDDTAQSIMMNFVRGDVERLARMAPHVNVRPGLIPRFMPLREIPEKETLLYAILSGLEFWDGVCPYWEAALRNQYRSVIDGLEDRSPGARYGIISSFDTIRPMLLANLPQSDLHPCPKCGEPTVGSRCKTCQLVERAKSRIAEGRLRHGLLRRRIPDTMGLFSSSKPFKTIGLGMHWDTEDPFLFVSHHEDDYPHGNRQQAPPLAEISCRNLGRDYQLRLGFRMYHGKVVPGFPMHAHWGYETVTLPEKGYIDHYDTERIEGRFGFGDVQWVSASSKYEHCEMYPLVNQEDRNPNDITQIMVNLPLEMKNQGNSVSTVWSEDVPVVKGDGWSAKVLCGTFGGRSAESPNPVSYARISNGVRIVRFSLGPGAVVRIDPAMEGANRNLYFVSGKDAKVMGIDVQSYTRMKFSHKGEFEIENGPEESVFWLLEGRPIGQKMSMFGPVVLEDLKEVRRALDDIRKNEFLEWPWDIIDKAQPLGTERFIRYPDGTESRPGKEERNEEGCTPSV